MENYNLLKDARTSKRTLEAYLGQLAEEVKAAEQAVTVAKKALEVAEAVDNDVWEALNDRLFDGVEHLEGTEESDKLYMNATFYDAECRASNNGIVDAEEALEEAKKLFKGKIEEHVRVSCLVERY